MNRLLLLGLALAAALSLTACGSSNPKLIPQDRADSLNQAGVPTAQGGKKWYAATVRHVLLRTS